MGRLKPDMRNLSQGEADTIVSFVKKVLDVIGYDRWKTYFR